MLNTGRAEVPANQWRLPGRTQQPVGPVGRAEINPERGGTFMPKCRDIVSFE
ncbi:MAG: hypothetical protein ACI8V2_002631 [Candidatus Latescibacterota bacterium]|jgi:hypothetical protein